MPSTPRTTPAVGTSTDPTAPATSPDDERLALQRDPLRFGVGARVTVAVMADDYVDVILGALAGLDTTGLVTQTGDVSTYVGGSEDDVQRWVTDVADAVARTGRHASLTLTLSRGCPGEVACELPGGAGPRVVPVALPRRTGTRASAEWALYPLADAPAHNDKLRGNRSKTAVFCAMRRIIMRLWKVCLTKKRWNSYATMCRTTPPCTP